LLKTIIYFTNKKVRLAQYNLSKQSLKLVKDSSMVLDDPDDLLAINNFIQKQKITKTSIIGCLFRHQVSIRFFSFPSHENSEIDKMVQYEVAELLPLKPEETIVRYQLLKKRDNGYSDTLVVVTHKEEVTKLLDKFKDQAIGIESLSLSSLALMRCLENVLSKENADDAVLLVYIEDGIVEIIIARNKIIEFSRGFLIEDINSFSQVLISEIRHSMELFFNNTDDNKLKKIILGSPKEDLKHISEVLKQRFDVDIKEMKIEIADGIAALDSSEINMLSNDFVLKKSKQVLKKNISIGLILLFVNVLLLGGIFMVQLNSKQKYLEKLNKEIALLEPQAESVQNKLRKLEIVKQQLSSQMMTLDAITAIVDIVPVSTNLNMLSINEEAVLLIRGQAKTLQEVLDFVGSIEKSEYFINGHLNYSNRRKMKDRELIDFEIQAQIYYPKN